MHFIAYSFINSVKTMKYSFIKLNVVYICQFLQDSNKKMQSGIKHCCRLEQNL